MQVSVKSGEALQKKADTLVLPVCSQDPARSGVPRHIAAANRALGGAIAAAIQSGDFRGRADELHLLHPGANAHADRVLLVGIGDEKKLDAEGLRRAAGQSVQRATAKGARVLAIQVPKLRRLKPTVTAAALAEGAVLGGYRFDTYRSKKRDDPTSSLRAVHLYYDPLSEVRATRTAAAEAVIIAESQNLARQLSNEPANQLPPAALANEARKMARKVGLKSRIMRETELEKLGMQGILSVGQGSANPPRLILLEHAGASRGGGTICLVGKGITFDSGGISIKPSAGMQDMKHDMSGAAAVIGAMHAVAKLGLPHRVIGVAAAAENMPGPTAYRPGDIIDTLAGKTIEVLNTDAEGRIVLADALHYARREYGPDAILDVATLTGAMMVALGSWATGFFTNDDGLSKAIVRAGERTGEITWPMPLLDGHKKAMKSPVADLRNTGGRSAGASTAAAFLSEFVGDTPWAHLDIAGTGWTEKASGYQPRGATGVGVRLLVDFLRGWSPSHLN